jgi:hypothetical protein
MMRAVFEKLDIYRLEDTCFSILGARPPAELPLDVFARLALFFLACCPITYAILHPDAQQSEDFWKIFVPEKRYKTMALLIPLAIAAYGEITRWRDRTRTSRRQAASSEHKSPKHFWRRLVSSRRLSGELAWRTKSEVGYNLRMGVSRCRVSFTDIEEFLTRLKFRPNRCMKLLHSLSRSSGPITLYLSQAR